MTGRAVLAAIAASVLVAAAAPAPAAAGDLTASEVRRLATAASALAHSLGARRSGREGGRPSQPKASGHVGRAAKQAQIPPALIASIIKCESDWNPRALSSKGARGLMQVMPRTARDELGLHPDELWNPRANVAAGTSYLRQLAFRFDGDAEKVVAAYNAGPTRLSRGRALPAETIRFRDCVRRWHARYAAWLD